MSAMIPLRRDAESSEELHRRLAASHSQRLSPRFGPYDFDQELIRENAIRRSERAFVEAEREQVAEVVRGIPVDSSQFVTWFEGLRESGPGQNDRLFPWLANHASVEQMRWFLEQELAGEAGFDDLVALTQVKMPTRPKLEMAHNYWDEMGQGTLGGMHGPMLTNLADTLELSHDRSPVWESLALGNLMVALATARNYAYESVGALGVIELTAPGRATLVNAGLKRLGIGGAARRYYALHATLDVRHSQTWDREVLGPLVERDPSVAPHIAAGALMRLNAGARCFARYRKELWGASLVPSG